MPSYFEKDPDATLDYAVKWSDWLHSVSDEASSITWDVPDGLTLDHEVIVDGNTEKVDAGTTVADSVAIVWLSGGEVGATYAVTSHIVTVDGRADDKTIIVRIAQR